MPETHDAGLRVSGLRATTNEEHSHEMFKDAARRVVFYNCMDHCEIPHESISNFNSTFYYSMHKEQACLQSCNNAKMLLHFGEEQAKKDSLLIDFKLMKREYQAMENWNPNMKVLKPYAKGYAEEKVESLTQQLLHKTKSQQQRY